MTLHASDYMQVSQELPKPASEPLMFYSEYYPYCTVFQKGNQIFLWILWQDSLCRLTDLWTCKYSSASPLLQDINQNAFICFRICCNQRPAAQQWLRFSEVLLSAFLNTSSRLNLLTYWTRYCESAHESSEQRLRPSIGTVINVL